MTSGAGADDRGHARGAGDGPGVQVDAEAVLGEMAVRRGRRLHLDAGEQAGLFHLFQEFTGSVGGIAVDRRPVIARGGGPGPSQGDARAARPGSGCVLAAVLAGWQQVGEEILRGFGVPAVTRGDSGSGDDLRIRIDRDVALQCRASRNAA